MERARPLLDCSEYPLGIRLNLSSREQKREKIKELLGDDRLSLRRGTKRKREEVYEEELMEEDEEGEHGYYDQVEDTGERLLEVSKHNSGRECYRLRPDVWTSHGKWNNNYRHLEGVVKEIAGAGGNNGRVTIRPWVSWIMINGTRLQTGFITQQADDY
ncbi:hypothetical protein CDV36_009169 [Fusarium kuroshium]|uniref:Uncharacterized protein n=1 Tax=Fusarium kuroshium TaxID=2010991 RepID=A0A3M2S0Y5_9HYPO|nr:hypothetical protein CDV36_009169 [Fusarium kuroshium]